MLYAFLSTLRWDQFPRTKLSRLLLISQIAALFWFGLGYFLFTHFDTIRLFTWGDQVGVMRPVAYFLANPYVVSRFVSPVFVPVFLLPFTIVPGWIAILIQICLTTGLLAGLIYKYNGNWRTLLLVMTCYIMFHVTIELNIDWIVYIGLLLPPVWSVPFLAAKPQLAYSVVLSFSRRDFVRFLIVGLILLLATFVVWKAWPLQMLDAVRTTVSGASWNIALINLITPYVAIPVGLWLAWRGFRRRDPVICTLAGFFFIPYSGFYSYILPFTLAALRFPRWVIMVYIVLWFMFGPLLLSYIQRGL